MALAWCAALVVPEDRLSPSSKSKDAGLEGLARGVESGAMGEAVALTLRTTGEALRAANVPRSFERAIVETARRFCLEPVAAVAAVTAARRAAPPPPARAPPPRPRPPLAIFFNVTETTEILSILLVVFVLCV